MSQYFEIAKAVFQKKEKYLLLRRAPHSVSYPGTWDFAGGKLDPGETPSESVIRETQEETAVDISPGSQMNEAVHEDADYKLRFYYFYPPMSDQPVVLSSDHTEFRWATKEDMESMDLHPSVQKFLEIDSSGV